MSTFIFADTHLDHTGEKPMDIFGPAWENHPEKLRLNAQKLISPEDNVIVAGDISWAMHIEDAAKDLQFLEDLNGKRKILLKGNHDFWWSTKSKVNRMFKKHNLNTLEIMQNEAKLIKNKEKDFILVGTRGWLIPNKDTDAADKKVYEREVHRFKLSLEDVKRLKKAEGITEDLDLIAIFHYPPVNKYGHDSEMSKLIEAYGIKKVYYGHVHKQVGNDERLCFQGVKNNIPYRNVAMDYIDSVPVKICD